MVAEPNHPAWRWAQWLGLLATVALLVGLLRRPEPTLNLLWNGIIPVLPAVFLVNPLLWRNVCPLATLTTLSGDRMGTRTLDGGLVRATLVLGALLLVVLVSGRRVVFNTDGPMLASVIVLVGGLAVAGGTRYQRKAGFCNSICPVLPVERLYGQAPLLRVANARCPTCIRCTLRGCIDRSPADATRTAIGARASSPSWLHSPYGWFAAGFPGFITGYFTIGNSGWSGAPALLLHVGTAIGVSLAVTMLLVHGLRLSAAVALPILASAAVGLYYWFASAAIAEAWGLAPAATWSLRGAAAALIGWWLVHALRPRARRRTEPPRGAPA